MLIATMALLMCSAATPSDAGAPSAVGLHLDVRALEGTVTAGPGVALPAGSSADEPPGDDGYEPRWSARLRMAGALVAADAFMLELFVITFRESLSTESPQPTLALAGLFVVPPAVAAMLGGAPAHGAAYGVGFLVHMAAVLAMAVAPPASLVLGVVLDAWMTPAVMDRIATAAARETRASQALPVRDPVR